MKCSICGNEDCDWLQDELKKNQELKELQAEGKMLWANPNYICSEENNGR